MLQQSDFSNPINRLKMSVLVGITASAISTFLLFVGAAFGSELAMQVLLNLSLPKFNIFANLIPADLSQANNGVQLMLGVIILQGSLVLSALIFTVWSFTNKR